MSPEKLEKMEKLETPKIKPYSDLEFSSIQKYFGEPLTDNTRYFFQNVYKEDLNSNVYPALAKLQIEKLARFCKEKKISQSAISSLHGDECGALSISDNLGTMESYLEREEELVVAKKRIEGNKQVIVEADSRIERKKQVIVEKAGVEKQVDQVIVEKDKTIEQLKQQLSSISKLTIEESKYAPFLLKEKGEGEATGEDEKLNGTLLGGALTNETYAKLKYLTLAKSTDTFLDESKKEITVGEYRDDFEKKYGSSLQKTLDDIDSLMYNASLDKNGKSIDKNESSTIWTESRGKGNPNGFNNSLSKLRGEFRSGNSKFDGYLDRKIGDVLSRERLTQDKGELENIGLSWGSELRSEIAEKKNSKGEKPTEADNAKWEARKNNEVIQNMSKDKIFAVIEGIVDSEADREIYAEELNKYINETYINATREKHPPINPHKEMQLNMLFRKSFLVYTRMIMKNQIAEQYLGKVSDMISAGGDKLLIKDDKDAIEYDEYGGMRIKYHTAQCAKHHTDSGPGLEGEIYIDPNGKISITDLMGLDNQNGQNELKKTPRVLTGRIIPVNEMINKLKDDKPTFSQQWHDRVLASDPKVYRDGDYSRALKSRVHNILSYNPDEELSENMASSSMRHTLESTKLFDTFAKFQETFPTNPPKTDTFMKYYQGSVNTIPNTPEYKSLFVMRNMMRSEGGNTINRFDSNVNKLIQTYAGNTSKETNPFLGEYANEKMRKMFESFVTNDRGLPRFSIEHFEKFVTLIAKERPANIDEWLMADVKGRLEILLPWGSEKFKELTKKNSEKEAKEMESLIDSEIPSAPGGGGWLRIQAASPQLATA